MSKQHVTSSSSSFSRKQSLTTLNFKLCSRSRTIISVNNVQLEDRRWPDAAVAGDMKSSTASSGPACDGTSGRCWSSNRIRADQAFSVSARRSCSRPRVPAWLCSSQLLLRPLRFLLHPSIHGWMYILEVVGGWSLWHPDWSISTTFRLLRLNHCITFD